MEFKEFDINRLSFRPFQLISKDWTLITSGDSEGFNTMTASWGGVGVIWNKKVATIYIRPQRYTYEFIEKNELLTLSFFDPQYRAALNLCGSKSGRNCDKVAEAGLTPLFIDHTTGFEEASMILVCKKLYYNDLDPAHFLEKDIQNNYPNNDYHRMYIAEIVKAYRNQETLL